MSKTQSTNRIEFSFSFIVRCCLNIAFIPSLFLFITLWGTQKSEAVPSALDSTFDSDGIASYESFFFTSNDMIIQPDGQIIMAGMARTTSNNREFAAMRLNPDGSPDSSFDGDGKTTIDFTAMQDEANAVALQPDGKIVVVGYGFVSPGDSCFTIARLNSNGTLDTSFAGQGKIVGNLGAGNDSLTAVEIQADGKIIVGGIFIVGSGNRVFILIRYNPDGSLDSSFDSDGIVTTALGTESYLSDLFIQPDGKILATGESYESSAVSLALVRYNSDGSLDTSFDSDGKVLTPSISGHALAVQPDGKIVVAGTQTTGNSTTWNFGLARYNTDGSLDTSFDGDGTVITDFSGEEDDARDLTIQPDGKIIVAGRSKSGINIDFALARYNSNGTLDNSFASSGKFTSKVALLSGSTAVALQTDGKIIASGGGIIARYMGSPRVLGLNGNPIAPADRAGSQGAPPGLPSANYPSTINISGMPGAVTKVRVTLKDITHTFPDNLDVLLVGPQGQQTIIMSDGMGGSDVSNLAITFDQNAPNLPDESSAINNAFYKPANYSGNDGANDDFPTPGAGSGNYGVANLDVFNGTNPNGTWKLYVVDDETQDTGSVGSWTLDITTGTSSSKNLTADFDGDGKSDLSIFRPSNGQWWYQQSLDNVTKAFEFGASTDKIVPGDYDGDGKTDIAFWRPSNSTWFVLRSSNLTFFGATFGLSTDIPAPGDFDGDGRTDITVFRPSASMWFVTYSSTSIVNFIPFGANGDIPAVGDYDGDGKADVASFRPTGSSGGSEWWVRRSAAGALAVSFGTLTDKPVVGDYTGDGKTDMAFFRPSTGEWFILRSENLSYYSAPFGAIGDIPSPGDYDGDGKNDLAVFRPSGATWFVLKSTGGTLIQSFGSTNDKPVPAAYVP